MARKIKKISKKIGMRPGSVVYVGIDRISESSLQVIDYDKSKLTEKTLSRIEDTFPFKDTPNISWINICGIHNVEIIKTLGQHFDLHALVLEDIVNTGQRPKIEETGEHIFIVLKMLYHHDKSRELVTEQVSLVFGERYLLSFQEQEGDVFDQLRERIRKTDPRIRFLDSDYLAYSLVDAIVDNYYLVLEELGEKLEEMQDILINNPTPENLHTIHTLKHQLVYIRKAVWPLREVVSGLERMENKLIKPETRPYIRDLYEHIIQVIDTVETYRDMVGGLLDTYMSSISNKMNEVMKVLTIIATIFIPLSFLAGVYGMNFDTSASKYNLPELGLPYGYLLFWGVALAVGGGMFVYFRKKKWL